MSSSILSRSIEFLPPAALAWVHYVRRFWRLPHLFPPVTFNEHITHRLIFDRDPLLKTACDKIAVKELVRQRAGENYVTPLLGAWSRVEDVLWDTLPDEFVLKPSFTSGPFAIVHADTDREELAQLAKTWLPRRPPHRHYSEWGYKGVPRRLMAEPLLHGRDGGEALEFDVHVFNGRVLLMRLLSGRKLTPGRRDAWFDRDCRQLNLQVDKIPGRRAVLEPALRDELIDVGECIGAGFTFMRVDFYASSDGVKVGELTPYPWGGQAGWADPEYDRLMGSLFAPSADTSIFADYVP